MVSVRNYAAVVLGHSRLRNHGIDTTVPSIADGLHVAFLLRAFEKGNDCLGVAVAETEVGLKPFDYLAGLDGGPELAVGHETFCVGELAEVLWGLAGLGLDVVQVCLE